MNCFRMCKSLRVQLSPLCFGCGGGGVWKCLASRGQFLEVWDICSWRQLLGSEGSPQVQQAPKARFLFPGISCSQRYKQMAFPCRCDVCARDPESREDTENCGHLRVPSLGTSLRCLLIGGRRGSGVLSPTAQQATSRSGQNCKLLWLLS